MQFTDFKIWIKSCLFSILFLFCFSLAYSQNAQEEKEISGAIENAKIGNYEQAIPFLQKHSGKKSHDDLLALSINYHLNMCYFFTNNELFDIDRLNLNLDSYILKNNISRTYIIKSANEIELIYDIGLINIEKNNLLKAQYYFSILEDIYEENQVHNSAYLKILQLLTKIYIDLNDYKSAISTGHSAIIINTSLFGDKNETNLDILQGLYIAYFKSFLFQEAIDCLFKAEEIGRVIWGESDLRYLTILNNLASTNSDIGNNKKALEIFQKVIELRKAVSGERDPEYLKDLINMGKVYFDLGEYFKALEIDIKVVESLKDILGENNSLYISGLNNLVYVYSSLGNFKKSYEISQKAVELEKQLSGDKSIEYLMRLGGLANVYSHFGNYQKALEINLKIVALLKEISNVKNPIYLTALNNLAYNYSKLENYQKSLEINQEVTSIRKETIGEKHPDYLTSLANLALNYTNLGFHIKALPLYNKVNELSKDLFGEDHPYYLKSLGNLAGAELDVSENDSAVIHFSKMLKRCRVNVNYYFGIMTEKQRVQFWNQNFFSFLFLPLFIEKAFTFNQNHLEEAYNICLFIKGLVLNSSIDFTDIIFNYGTPESIQKFEELKLLKLQIQKLHEKPIAERYLDVDSLENIAEQKETELVKLSKEYGDYTQNLKINWKDVQANLGEKDVAIEFVEYPTLTDTVKYAALILRKDWQYPKMIPLFRKDQIDPFIKENVNLLYSNKSVGKEIKRHIWNPLEEFISPGEKVYFSPAGIIHQLAIENLPVNDSFTLGDQYQMFRLSSTKELAINKTVESIQNAVVYGGLKYDLDVKDMLKESKKYENVMAFQGYSNDTTTREEWGYLENTLPEVESISGILRNKNFQVKEFTGELGNEESFKALSGKKPGIIHIATHGFFQTAEESRKNVFMQMRMGDQNETVVVDPMLRSGLILSGGNHAWLGKEIPDNIEDGVLTAREISRMDLRGTDLVVLSACKTGLGEISSEGVFGLQRSFKQAGVNTLLMSLWKVHDEATSFMMTEFYKNLASGKDKRSAFLEAKRKCKEKYKDPQYWAAFIMLN